MGKALLGTYVLTALATASLGAPCLSAEFGALVEVDAVGQQALERLRAYIFENVSREYTDANATSRSGWQAEAFAGREDLYAHRIFDSRQACVALDEDPIRLIAKRARDTNIVIINEHHASPLDRNFIGQVLEALRSKGYSYYAAETFSQYDDLNHNDVLGSDGWYSSEPIFGRTVRLAKRLGYSLISYEQTQVQAEEVAKEPANSPLRNAKREQSQTDNLVAAIFGAHPRAKVVIHVGHSHVRERTPPPSLDDGNTWMAQRLKNATASDPLSISQIDCRSTSARTIAAEARLTSEGEVEKGSHVDLYVGHSNYEFRNGRPAWRQTIGDRVVKVPTLLRSQTERVIVEARPEGAGLGAVPLDRILLFPGEELPLLLPPGRYRIDGFVNAGPIEVPPVLTDVR